MPDPAMPDPSAALIGLFGETGIPLSYAEHVATHLGASAAESLRGDPWRLLLVPGIRPDQADHFARAVLGDGARPGDPRRGRALVTHLLARAARDGHTATPGPDLVSALAGLRVPDPVRSVEEALDEASVMAFVDEPAVDGPDGFDPAGDAGFDDLSEPEPEPVLGLARPALAEEALAEGVMRLLATASPLPVEAGDGPLADLAALVGGAGVAVLRVPAGTDPDGPLLALVRVSAEAGVRVRVACATGRAARALARRYGPEPAGEFTSLHQLLEARQAAGGIVFTRDERLPIDADLVIVPDAQSLDVEPAAALVEACADGTHLLLAGDPSGLPSAGPGRVLGDLADSGAVPVVDLPAAASGPIAWLTMAVASGRLPAVEAPDREVVIVPAGGVPEAVHRTLQLVTDSIPRALGIGVEDIQVITAAARGAAGVHALNTALKERLNPAPAGRPPGNRFAVGDRVIVTSPLAEAPAGESGIVASVADGELTVLFAAGPATVPATGWSRLRHGWAITVGEARGGRWPAVVVVLPPGAPLSRPVIAAAFGRAVRHLSVVQAAGPALADAVRSGSSPSRRTRLAALLRA